MGKYLVSFLSSDFVTTEFDLSDSLFPVTDQGLVSDVGRGQDADGWAG